MHVPPTFRVLPTSLPKRLGAGRIMLMVRSLVIFTHPKALIHRYTKVCPTGCWDFLHNKLFELSMNEW